MAQLNGYVGSNMHLFIPPEGNLNVCRRRSRRSKLYRVEKRSTEVDVSLRANERQLARYISYRELELISRRLGGPG